MFENDEQFAKYLTEHSPELEDYPSPYTTDRRLISDCYGIAIYTESDIAVSEMDGWCKYFFEGPFAGEYYGLKVVDCPPGRIFFVNTDFTKSRHDDIFDGIALIEPFFRDGSPVRKTDRSGPGTKGTKAIEGFGDSVFFIAYEGYGEENDSY